MPPWRNRLARSAVNRKVGGSSPPGGAATFLTLFHASNYRHYNPHTILSKVFLGEGKGGGVKKFFDPSRIRTCNLLIRSQTRYPLRHGTKFNTGLQRLKDTSSKHLKEECGKAGKMPTASNGFLSVVVITCPSHGQGRRFDPGRKHGAHFFYLVFISFLLPLCGGCQGHQLAFQCWDILMQPCPSQRLARWSRGMILA